MLLQAWSVSLQKVRLQQMQTRTRRRWSELERCLKGLAAICRSSSPITGLRCELLWCSRVSLLWSTWSLGVK